MFEEACGTIAGVAGQWLRVRFFVKFFFFFFLKLAVRIRPLAHRRKTGKNGHKQRSLLARASTDDRGIGSQVVVRVGECAAIPRDYDPSELFGY